MDTSQKYVEQKKPTKINSVGFFYLELKNRENPSILLAMRSGNC